MSAFVARCLLCGSRDIDPAFRDVGAAIFLCGACADEWRRQLEHPDPVSPDGGTVWREDGLGVLRGGKEMPAAGPGRGRGR